MSEETVTVVPEGQLAFGVQLPVQALSSVIASEWEHDAGVPELVRAARAADAAGFFYVAICDHVAIPTAFAGPMSTTWFNPVATLGFLAAQTTNARLLTNIYVAPFRHPLDTAKAFSTLDLLSGGRVILGVGAGHVPGEFEALGVPFADRGRLLNEAIDGVKASWAAEYVGDVGLRPRPMQQPRPPIWVGGSKPPALRRVAERADGWIPQGTPRGQMSEQIAYLLSHRDDVRPGAEIEIGTITEHIYVGTPTWDVGEPTITGSPDAIAASLNEFGAMGVSHLQVRFRSRSIDELCDQFDAFGTQVGPKLGR
jgi:probable F420-dependent oxidoreductase